MCWQAGGQSPPRRLELRGGDGSAAAAAAADASAAGGCSLRERVIKAAKMMLQLAGSLVERFADIKERDAAVQVLLD